MLLCFPTGVHWNLWKCELIFSGIFSQWQEADKHTSVCFHVTTQDLQTVLPDVSPHLSAPVISKEHRTSLLTCKPRTSSCWVVWPLGIGRHIPGYWTLSHFCKIYLFLPVSLLRGFLFNICSHWGTDCTKNDFMYIRKRLPAVNCSIMALTLALYCYGLLHVLCSKHWACPHYWEVLEDRN